MWYQKKRNETMGQFYNAHKNIFMNLHKNEPRLMSSPDSVQAHEIQNSKKTINSIKNIWIFFFMILHKKYWKLQMAAWLLKLVLYLAYECRLIQYFYRISFHESRVRLMKKSLYSWFYQIFLQNSFLRIFRLMQKLL